MTGVQTCALPILPLLLALGPTAAWRHGGIGAGRDALRGDPGEVRQWINERRRWVLWETDGVESSVALTHSNGLSFVVNGKSDGNSLLDAGTQVMSGLVGSLLHPAPRRSLVIGLGTGTTAGWLGQVRGMERVDVVEIEPAIVEVARQCSAVNERVLDNPRVHLVFDDAREVLLSSKESYDIIFSEPSNPYRAGISSLFSRQFYQAVKRRMAPGGLFLQWLQAYEVDALTVRSVYATLLTEFGAVETWRTQEGDLLLVATEAPLRHDLERMRASVAAEPYRRILPLVWTTDELEGVLSNFIAGPATARALAEDQEELINTDDLSYVEFSFARSVGRPSSQTTTRQLRGVAIAVGADRPEVARGTVDWQRVEELRVLQEGELTPRRADLDGAAIRRRRAFDAAFRQQRYPEVLRLWREAGWEPRGTLDTLRVAQALVGQGDGAALPLLTRLESQRPVDTELLRMRLHLRQGRLPEATQAFERATTLLKTTPWVDVGLLGEALDATSRVARADPALGRRLWTALAQPFTGYANERSRQPARLELAGAVDFRGLCAEALVPFEPHVLWSRDLLEERARCYTLTAHPLEARALEDLSRFLEEQPSVLWTPPPAPGGPPASGGAPEAPPGPGGDADPSPSPGHPR